MWKKDQAKSPSQNPHKQNSASISLNENRKKAIEEARQLLEEIERSRSDLHKKLGLKA